ncbi:MAG: hypothetical protein ABR577_16760 [Pyrinomonadaceae bacterium]
MKIKSICYAASLVLAATLSFAFFAGKPIGAAAFEVKPLAIEVRSDKKSYVPGEPVALKFKVINKSNTPISVEGADVQHGYLKVLIAYQGEDFKEYLGPQWGLQDDVDGGVMTVEPQGSFETEATVLYNHRLESCHLSEIYVKQNTSKRVETEYALNRPGEYRIKTSLYTAEAEREIESEPISISVEEPKGDDLEVWNRIKGDAAYGYFIQTGDLMAHPNSAKAKRVVGTLEEIVNMYPSSRYAEHIRDSLARFKVSMDDLKKKGILKQED